jgi:hypothetical protein
MQIKFLLPPLFLLVLYGCANGPSKFKDYARGKNEPKTIQIVSVGKPKTEYMSDKLGGSLGLLGALLEYTVTKDKRESHTNANNQVIDDNNLNPILNDKLSKNLQECGFDIELMELKNPVDYDEWQKSKSVNEEIKNEILNKSYLIEVNLRNIFIHESSFKTSLSATVEAKIFDLKSKEMIDKIVGSNIADGITLKHYKENDTDKAIEIIDATKESIQKVAKNLSDRICQKN